MKYYAHSDPDNPCALPDTPGARWEPLEEHLRCVAERAAHFARALGAEDEARLAGLLHEPSSMVGIQLPRVLRKPGIA